MNHRIIDHIFIKTKIQTHYDYISNTNQAQLESTYPNFKILKNGNEQTKKKGKKKLQMNSNEKFNKALEI